MLFHTERNRVVGYCVLGEQTMRVLRAEMGWGRYRSACSKLLLSALLAGCSIDAPAPAPSPDVSEPPPDETVVPIQNPPRPPKADAGVSVDVDADMQPSTPMGSLGGCTDGATKPCGPDTVAGTCRLGTRSCQQGMWSECEGAVMPGTRDCSSALDNDCDGHPDNAVDDYCRCTVDMTEPCQTHPGFDGHGPCLAGERSCTLASDRQSSDWGECTGAVGPIPEDSCTQRGDDSDCDGRPNGNCACIEGEEAECGPAQSVGICKKGKSTCVNGRFGDCIGAVYPKPRDCRSAIDNDCNGQPDSTLDNACTCAVGQPQACGTHPQDGVGICTAGTQTCVASVDNRTSAFNACTGSVGPAARNCTSALDNNCDGAPDNTLDATCACTIGVVSACLPHVGLDGFGICHAGQALCIAGLNNASSALGVCSGSVGPLLADSCTVAGDDSNCNGIVNDACQCIVSTSCTDPASARCSAGVCVACASNTDCTHIPGAGVCSAGACVQCVSAANCALGQLCIANSCVTVLPVPVPPPPPPPPPPAPVTP